MINPITKLADLFAARVTGYPRVPASRPCDHCGVQKGMRHRLAGCEGNERDVRRGFLVDYAGEDVSDAELDRRYDEALEAYRRNTESEGRA